MSHTQSIFQNLVKISRRVFNILFLTLLLGIDVVATLIANGKAKYYKINSWVGIS